MEYEYNEKELDSPETLEAVEKMITSSIEENSAPKLNRAQRRAIMKKVGKKNYSEQSNAIGETARKLNYIDLIQKIRKMNEEKENENYEAITENS